ncbi:uncharacterized protein [Nicotiana sylvestris]|uniref:Uncharacterized protein LOC104225567 isoform X3 n=2 Tax=Nicotiana sylvestris TaxID=4096 RepID=A0A1U7WAM6_NICSY|nr:PREDICTED: uncharacterized protein LOC104225567 isoform X3 [Nicotiana sylvestris]
MNVLFNACSAVILTRTGSRAVKSSIGAISALSWKTGVGHNAARKVDFDLLLKRICFRCYSSKKSSGDSSSSEKSDPTPKMKEDRDGFFVVRKGDLVGVYKNLSDCQTQVGSSQPSSSKGGMPEHMPKKRSQEVMWSEYSDAVGSAVISNDFLRKHVKLDDHKGDQALPSGRSCTLEFDGASKGNPGLAGAGAVLRADDGSFICRLREGLGVATNNAAEYRGIILGLKYALSKGFTSIRVQGDSKLVCMQIQGLWKVKNQNISTLYEQAKQLKDRFLSFRIIHVLRESNSDADVQANLGVELAEGQIQEEIEK